jgi:hypothetical protein
VSEEGKCIYLPMPACFEGGRLLLSDPNWEWSNEDRCVHAVELGETCEKCEAYGEARLAGGELIHRDERLPPIVQYPCPTCRFRGADAFYLAEFLLHWYGELAALVEEDAFWEPWLVELHRTAVAVTDHVEDMR